MQRIRAGGNAYPLTAWLRIVLLLAIVWGVQRAIQTPQFLSAVFAQETNPGDEPALEDMPAGPPNTAAPAAAPPGQTKTIMQWIKDGGWIGGVIMLLSLVAVGFIVEHFLTIRKQRLMPERVLKQVEELVAKGDYAAATEYCQDPRNYSLASDVMLAGLERFQGSEFGFAEYKSAVEEAGEEFTARLYRKTDMLSVIGAIAPMLGLLGTVEGIMESFNTLAAHGGMARPDELAGGIGKALITTFQGLVVAIPAMVAFSYFRNQIDSIVSECGKRVERILMPLGRAKR
jgi:biopolymer transport protein ExbB